MSGIKAEELPRLFPSDSMEPALMIMADVRAYFQGNYFRFSLDFTHEVSSGLQAFCGQYTPCHRCRTCPGSRAQCTEGALCKAWG